MSVFTTEIASDVIPSDNVIHQRLTKAYEAATHYIKGDVLELGCGEGRGIEFILRNANSYFGIDKIDTVIEKLGEKYPDLRFVSGSFPPLQIEDNTFDCVVSFQVIEHVKNDLLFLKEIYRVLKPGGLALLTTPNILMTLSRNPWHIREYTGNELKKIAADYFDEVEMKGIAGNDRVMEYHEENRRSVNKIMKFDFLDLQHKLPAAILKVPYDILNRMNRKKLMNADHQTVNEITTEDFHLMEQKEDNLDLFLIAKKSD